MKQNCTTLFILLLIAYTQVVTILTLCMNILKEYFKINILTRLTGWGSEKKHPEKLGRENRRNKTQEATVIKFKLQWPDLSLQIRIKQQSS